MKKIFVRLGITISLPIISLIAFILFPGISYANKTDFEGLVVYHNLPLEEGYENILRSSIKLVEKSELFDKEFIVELCLDDQSWYPMVISSVKGPAFGFGLANKVVLKSDASFADNKAIGYGQSWNLAELIAHEMIHTYQFNRYGFGTLSTPTWKLEGYAEYVSRSQGELSLLNKSIELMLIERKKAGGSHWVWIKIKDGSGLPSQYLVDKILVQYLMEIETLTYDQVKKDTRPRIEVEQQVLKWFDKQIQ
ncbi:hypothetical protein [Ekhidna sp.]